MLKPKWEGKILEKTDLEFENQAVLNPTCLKVDGVIHMYYRAVRSGNFSSIGYCQLKNNRVVHRLRRPLVAPEHDYEIHGVEDPRVVYLDGKYYLFYTAFDGKNALIAYATSKNLTHFKKHGIISPRITYDEAEDVFRQSKLREKYFLFESFYKDKGGPDILLWEKDAFLFPKKIKGKFALMHRILPGIQIIYFDNFRQLTSKYWRKYLKDLDQHIVLDPLYWYESRNIGGGCTPIETKDGWLIVYHAVEDQPKGKIYHAAAALLDINNPTKVIGRLPEPLFSPTKKWEKQGDVSNVVFPTGAVVDNDDVTIYYGAADKLIAAKTFSLSKLITILKNNPQPH